MRFDYYGLTPPRQHTRLRKNKTKNPSLKWHGHQHWYTARGQSTAEPAGYTKSHKNFDFVVVYNNNGHLGSLQQSYQWISRFLSKKNPFVTTTISPTSITTMPRTRYTKKNHAPNVVIRQFGSCNNFCKRGIPAKHFLRIWIASYHGFSCWNCCCIHFATSICRISTLVGRSDVTLDCAHVCHVTKFFWNEQMVVTTTMKKNRIGPKTVS